MPQDLSRCHQAPGSAFCHSRESSARCLPLSLSCLLLCTLLIATPARAQARASLQVAATVLPAEPSRSALLLVAQALREPRSGVRESRLAQVTVAPDSARSAARPARRVRVDFLRN